MGAVGVDELASGAIGYPSAVMDVQVREGRSALEQVADEWRALWERDPVSTLFQRPEYVEAWVPEIAGDRRVVTVEMRRSGALQGFTALSVDPDGVLRFLGDPDVTDYFAPLCEPADREAVAEGLIEATGRIDGWREAEFLGLAADTGWADAIARAAKGAGFDVRDRRQDVCPRVAIPGSYDDYLASLDGKLRHEIRRKARKLEREAGAFTVRYADPARMHDELETFFEMHRTSAGPKGHFLHWGMAGFFTLLSRIFEREGWLRFAFLDIDGTPVASVLSFAVRGTWYVYNSSFDHTKRDLAPGMVLMAECIRLAAEEGAHTFDLMRGDEPYKYRFGAVDVPLTALTVTRES